ncbi:MAG TPA: integrase arm-type DNA-binding domain-containing protein [Pseudaminobacter sp.]|nr:integrase arm-type DNA-binding domain-containing protein [Pseudaminobacter sp.]
MARAHNKLTETAIRAKNLKTGRHGDGGGLYLVVSPGGGKYWAFVWVRGGVWNELGLGSYGGATEHVSLAMARERAQEQRKILGEGGDPKAVRAKQAEPTFAECADAFISEMEKSWSNPKHRAQWRMTLGEAYCKPILDKRVSDVGTDDILGLLKPVWQKKPETATRLRGRIERVLNYAKAKGWRSGENPAAWRGHLQNLLAKPGKLVRGHHAAMPYQDVPAFFVRVKAAQGVSARALELTMLTVVRTGELVAARWTEVDLEKAVWTVPAERMKTRKEHRVPLSAPAVAMLKDLAESRTSEFVFPGVTRGDRTSPLSTMAMTMQLRRMKADDFTVHGFRSSFRDWAGDETSFAREIAEAALAHKVGNAVEQSYRRGDALAKRRKLMDAWATFLGETKADNVIRARFGE